MCKKHARDSYNEIENAGRPHFLFGIFSYKYGIVETEEKNQLPRLYLKAHTMNSSRVAVIVLSIVAFVAVVSAEVIFSQLNDVQEARKQGQIEVAQLKQKLSELEQAAVSQQNAQPKIQLSTKTPPGANDASVWQEGALSVNDGALWRFSQGIWSMLFDSGRPDEQSGTWEYKLSPTNDSIAIAYTVSEKAPEILFIDLKGNILKTFDRSVNPELIGDDGDKDATFIALGSWSGDALTIELSGPLGAKYKPARINTKTFQITK